MPSPRDIPGFYFDTERGKYFRIQPNHQAPKDAAHSQEAVNAKIRSDEAEKIASLRQIRAARGVQRPGFSGYTSLALNLRFGARPAQNTSACQRQYAADLKSRLAHVAMPDRLQAMTISPRGDLCAVFQEGNGAIDFVQSSKPSRSRLHVLPRHATVLGDSGHPQFEVLNHGHVVYITNGELMVCNYESPVPHLPVQVINLNMTTWDSATSPSSNSLAIVGATEEERFWFIKDVSECRPTRIRSLRHEQMVVAFKDENIIMSGERNGRVNLTDHRSSTTVTRLKHASGVTGLSITRSPDHLLVSGLQATALYDLRYLKAFEKFGTERGKNKKRSSRHSSTSKPMLRFYVPPELQSDHYAGGKSLAYIPYYDIAVVRSRCSLRGMNMCARTRDYDRVTLYDTSTGRILPSPLTSAQSLGKLYDLKVGRTRDGPPSIFLRKSDTVMEWAVDTLSEVQREGINSTLSVERWDLGHCRFPPDGQLGMNMKWDEGDQGPS